MATSSQGTVGTTGNNNVDALLWGNEWVGSNIYYHFYTAAEAGEPGFFTWTPTEMQSAQLAFDAWEAVADVNFVEWPTSTSPAIVDLHLLNAGSSVLGSTLGAFIGPDGTSSEGFGFFNWQGQGWNYSNVMQPGSYGFLTLLHEIGHGLGLAHPHDNGGTSEIMNGVTSSFGDYGTSGMNQGLFTVMTYNDGWDQVQDPYGTYGLTAYGYNIGPMALDIAAIQQIYGANTTHNTGNNTYTLMDVNQTGTGWSSIWDAGGTDEIVYGGSHDAAIFLQEATLTDSTYTLSNHEQSLLPWYMAGTTSVNLAGGLPSFVWDADVANPSGGSGANVGLGAFGGYTIANGVVIENASGGSGNDFIVGNDVRNLIYGNAGDDYVNGQGGNDRIDGGSGDDYILAGDGNDVVIGGDGADTIFGGETSADRSDSIYAGLGDDDVDGGYGNDILYGGGGNDFVRGGFGADFIAGQAGNDTVSGGAFADTLFGNDGNDFVNGGWGHDLMNGGSGADQFFHIGIFDHGSDWVQDFQASDGDSLLFGIGSATVDDFQVNFAHTANSEGERSGDDLVQEAFVVYQPTGQIIWALVDGGGQASINIQFGGSSDVFDLLA